MNIQPELFTIITEVEKYLTPDDINRLKEYFSHNEFGLVVEYICTQLVEYDITVSQELFEKIQGVGISMEMDKRIWEDVHTLKKNPTD